MVFSEDSPRRESHGRRLSPADRRHLSAFTAVREEAEVKAKALRAILQHGEDQLAQGKVKPVAEVVKRLRRVK